MAEVYHTLMLPRLDLSYVGRSVIRGRSLRSAFDVREGGSRLVAATIIERVRGGPGPLRKRSDMNWSEPSDDMRAEDRKRGRGSQNN